MDDYDELTIVFAVLTIVLFLVLSGCVAYIIHLLKKRKTSTTTSNAQNVCTDSHSVSGQATNEEQELSLLGESLNSP